MKNPEKDSLLLLWLGYAGITGTILAFFILIALVGSVSTLMSRAGIERSVDVETTDESVPYATVRLASEDLWENEERLVQPGRDGVLRHYTYFEEEYRDGELVSRKEIYPADEPESEMVSEATTKVVEYGVREGQAFGLVADDQDGVLLGKLDDSGALRFTVEGAITFAEADTFCDSFGNPSYIYTWTPLRPDIYPGALLVGVGPSRPWQALIELESVDDLHLVTGAPGQEVWVVVNDAPGYYDDNRGSFKVIVAVSPES